MAVNHNSNISIQSRLHIDVYRRHKSMGKYRGVAYKRTAAIKAEQTKTRAHGTIGMGRSNMANFLQGPRHRIAVEK